MPLHLLGKKSWNVYNQANIERVRRDEAAAANDGRRGKSDGGNDESSVDRSKPHALSQPWGFELGSAWGTSSDARASPSSRFPHGSGAMSQMGSQSESSLLHGANLLRGPSSSSDHVTSEDRSTRARLDSARDAGRRGLRREEARRLKMVADDPLAAIVRNVARVQERSGPRDRAIGKRKQVKRKKPNVQSNKVNDTSARSMPRFEAASYLSRHGWQGEGHTLGHKKNGISRPILSARKPDQGGIGNKKHEALSSQWWLNAFDISLQNLEPSPLAPDGPTEIETKKRIKKPLELLRTRGSKWLGLYDNFSKGITMSGTMNVAEGNEEQPGSPQIPVPATRSQHIPSSTDTSTKIMKGSKLKGNNAKAFGSPPSRFRPVDHSTTHSRKRKRKRFAT